MVTIMKRIISVFTLILMLFTLASCGGDGKSQKGFDKAKDLYEQSEKLNKKDLSEDEIADVEKQAELDGFEFKWNDDGTLYLEESDETIYYDSGEWIENRFTRNITKPTDGVISEIQVQGNRCSVVMFWTDDQASAYAEAYKDEFNKESEEEIEVIGSYSYYGERDDGATIFISRFSSTGTITITLPEL